MSALEMALLGALALSWIALGSVSVKCALLGLNNAAARDRSEARFLADKIQRDRESARFWAGQAKCNREAARFWSRQAKRGEGGPSDG